MSCLGCMQAIGLLVGRASLSESWVEAQAMLLNQYQQEHLMQAAAGMGRRLLNAVCLQRASCLPAAGISLAVLICLADWKPAVLLSNS